MGLKKVSYGVSSIQKLRRVALDQNLLDTLGLTIGDAVRIELDVEQEAVIITKVATLSTESAAEPNSRRRRAKG